MFPVFHLGVVFALKVPFPFGFGGVELGEISMVENELQTVGGGEPKRSGIPFVVVQTSGMLVNDVGRDGVPELKHLNRL